MKKSTRFAIQDAGKIFAMTSGAVLSVGSTRLNSWGESLDWRTKWCRVEPGMGSRSQGMTSAKHGVGQLIALHNPDKPTLATPFDLSLYNQGELPDDKLAEMCQYPGWVGHKRPAKKMLAVAFSGMDGWQDAAMALAAILIALGKLKIVGVDAILGTADSNLVEREVQNFCTKASLDFTRDYIGSGDKIVWGCRCTDRALFDEIWNAVMGRAGELASVQNGRYTVSASTEGRTLYPKLIGFQI